MTPTFLALHPLKRTLWHPNSRFDSLLRDQTFAPDFHEFGRSGRRYTRAEMLYTATARPFTAKLHGFTIRELSDTIAQTTYISELRTETTSEWANRS